MVATMTSSRSGWAARKARRRALAYERLALGCSVCGTKDGQLDFHHRDPSAKLFTISAGIGGRGTNDEFIAEMDKCDVLCWHCHHLEHEGGNALTAEETARTLGITSIDYVYRLCRMGVLDGTKHANNLWLIKRESVEAHRARVKTKRSSKAFVKPTPAPAPSWMEAAS
jgi:hypothetical protein